MTLDPIPDEFKHVNILEKFLLKISKEILFRKRAIMHGEGEFSKIKGSITNIPIDAANICNLLSRPAFSNEVIIEKLKRDFQYRSHVYFELVRPHIMYQPLKYLRSHNKFYEDISFANGPLSEDLFRFSNIVDIYVTEKLISDGEIMSENLNDNTVDSL